jgi:hypothetical protein
MKSNTVIFTALANDYYLDLSSLDGIQSLIISYSYSIKMKSELEKLKNIENIEIYACPYIKKDLIKENLSLNNLKFHNELSKYSTNVLTNELEKFLNSNRKQFWNCVVKLQLVCFNCLCKNKYEKTLILLEIMKALIYFKDVFPKHPDFVEVAKTTFERELSHMDEPFKSEAEEYFHEISKYFPTDD